MPMQDAVADDPTPSPPSQREVLLGLNPAVANNLALLTPVERSWQPSDYLPDFGKPDWREQLDAFRAPAEQLSDEVLVVLVGDMVTEEALPSYAVSLNLIADDRQGTSTAPWARWLRGWTSEENRHGDLLNAFLRLTGRVDMHAIEYTVQTLVSAGFDVCDQPTRLDVDHRTHVVRLSLPPPRILSLDIKRFETINEHSGFLNAISPADRSGWYQDARDSLTKATLEQGILPRAESHARELLGDLVSRWGYHLELSVDQRPSAQ